MEGSHVFWPFFGSRWDRSHGSTRLVPMAVAMACAMPITNVNDDMFDAI